MTTTVSDIDHIESQSLVGVGIIKVFFHPNVNIAQAVAEISAISQVQIRSLPPGTFPPFIIQYNASSVPVLQLGISGQGLNEQQLNDIATNTIRLQLSTVEGAQAPFPYGGKSRQIQVDLDLNALQARGLSPIDVVNAITAQNVIAPSGTIKLDRFEYQVETNSAPTLLDTLNNLPVKTVNGTIVYIHDVAHVRDGNPPQTNIVRVDGRRAIMMSIFKTGSSSTLDIIKGVRDILSSPSLKGQMPPQVKIVALADQSIFVRGAINGVVRECIIAACLTAIMILIFLGSWRSTIIIAVSIPLSILCSLILLYALHETINIMTLGGMALAVGILVDDATVAIENINRYLETGRELEQAILEGSAQIATPALVSTLAICIVFVPMFFLSGVARYLFVPIAATCFRGRWCPPWPSICCTNMMTRRRQENAGAEIHSPVSKSLLKPDSSASAMVTWVCSPSASIMRARSSSCFSSLPWPRSRWFHRWGRTSSHRSIRGSSSSTCAPTPARASKRRLRFATTSSRPFAGRFRPMRWSRFSTTSGCLTLP